MTANFRCFSKKVLCIQIIYALQNYLFILLLIILAACIGQRPTVSPKRLASLDCDLLEKKQRLEFKTAMRHAKAKERRKPMISKVPQRINTEKVLLPTPAEPIRNTNDAGEGRIVYIPTLESDAAEKKKVSYNLKETLDQEPNLASISALAPIATNYESDSEFVKFKNDTSIWPAMLLGGVLGIGALSLFKKEARALSRWSKENKIAALSLLVFVKTGTCVGCLFLGNELYNAGLTVPEYIKIPSLAILASALAFYPTKYYASGAPAFGFLERKIYDASIFTAGAIVMLYGANHYDVGLQRAHNVETVVYITLPSTLFGQEKNKYLSVNKREFKQQLKAFLNNEPKPMTGLGKTTLTVLAVLAAIVLTFGVAAATCSLACNGAEIVAFLVGVGGLALVIWGLVTTIRSIHKRPTKKRAVTEKSVA